MNAAAVKYLLVICLLIGAGSTAAAAFPDFAHVTVARSGFDPKVDLPRIRVGNQATVLAVVSRDGRQPLFDKGVDAACHAPISAQDRTRIFAALGISEDALDATAGQLMDNYTKFSERKKCLALLGVIGSVPGPALSDETRGRLEAFFVARLTDSWGRQNAIVLKRQAILNLALIPHVEPATVEAVLAFYERCTNLWETFPIPQFFEYHADAIKALPNAAEIRGRVARVRSLYTAQILKGAAFHAPAESAARQP